jgi:colicin import membrane protein
LSVEFIGWQDEHFQDHRRRLRNAMLVSLALHGSIFAAFAIAPPRLVVPMPHFIAIELIAAPPAASQSSRPSLAPPPAKKQAEPEPPPPEPAPPAPPVAKAPVQVLPEQSPGRIRKAKPEPKPALQRPRREQELSLEDAMAALADELGVDATADLLRPPPVSPEPENSSGQSESFDASQSGTIVSPELVKWNRDTQRLIQSKWVTPSNLRNRGLVTSLKFRLSASGSLIGKPKVLRSSGDPFFDDNAIRALLKVAPLPPPPEPGLQIFIFNAEAN